MLQRLLRFRWLTARTALLATSCGIVAWALPAVAQIEHGYVEPCTVEIVQDGNTQCESCSPTHASPQLCQDTLGAQGYQRKCRTGGHSAPGEVWCIARGAVKRAVHPSDAPYAAYAPYVLALAALSALFGVFLFLKRRQPSPK